MAASPWSGGVTDETAQIKVPVHQKYSPVELVISESSDLTSPVKTLEETSDENGWLTFDVTELEPDTQYHYGCKTPRGSVDLTKSGKFKTHPPVGSPANFKFAVSSCAGMGGTVNEWPANGSRISNAPVFEVVRALDPLFYAHIGDFHYKNIGDFDGDYNTYRSVYKTIQMAPTRAKFHRDIPLAFMFDNHDSAESGHANSTDVWVSKAVDPTYKQCIPSYPVGVDKLYQTWQIGRVIFIMTDERSHRDGATMLGATQKQWFKDTLSQTTAEFFVWLSVCNWSFDGVGWGIFPTERTELGDWLTNNGWADRMIMVTGNVHTSALGKASENPYGDFPEIIMSGMDSTGGTIGAPFTVLSPVSNYLWGMFEITDTGSVITCDIDGYDYDTVWGSDSIVVNT